MIITILLHPNDVALVVTPLKKLQDMQVKEFSKYGLSTLGINEDTPNDKELWEAIAAGCYRVLIVQAEQLFIDKGHWPRLARLFNKRRKFTHSIRFLFIDEAHHIYVSGTALYGLPAFRPAWSHIGELRTKLGTRTTVAALSGTLPAHIKKAVKDSLQLGDDNLCSIKLSCNRPNIAYALHEIVGSITDYTNLDFVISDDTGLIQEGKRRRKGIIFHDSIDGAVNAKRRHESLLHPDRRGTGVVKEYHALMSDEYLEKPMPTFVTQTELAKFYMQRKALQLCDVHTLPYAVLTFRRGSTIHSSTLSSTTRRPVWTRWCFAGIFLLMYENWATKVDISKALEDAQRSAVPLDPDRPVKGKLNPKKKDKRIRTGISMLQLVQNRLACLRAAYAKANDDDSVEGNYCCNRLTAHRNDVDRPHAHFDFAKFFPGKLLWYDEATKLTYRGHPEDPNRKAIVPLTSKRPIEAVEGSTPVPKYRATKERPSLISPLDRWRYLRWQNDRFRALRSPQTIISNKGLEKLAMIHPQDIHNGTKHLVVEKLKESQVWGEKYAEEVWVVLVGFDNEVWDNGEKAKKDKDERHKRAKVVQEAEDEVTAAGRFASDTATRAATLSIQVATRATTSQLSAEQIRQRIAELERESQAQIRQTEEATKATPAPASRKGKGKAKAAPKPKPTKTNQEMRADDFAEDARRVQAAAEQAARERLISLQHSR
ncbi:hypothetical protein FA13DRAFT_1785865 [Coprinellus micaceus]|uniref:DNA 3'-5' helicase n=1 Tax=Coprinellus micaceus TaxID=71717 RepID=A0A4Y7TWS3_COPMI|nr:hypothetical protein FA13DRAFT_1785865 [Coprinellus micaceus]